MKNAKKFESVVWVTVFYGFDLVCQVNGDEVTFSGNDMYLWRDGTICASYDLSKYARWCIMDKYFDVDCNKWRMKYFLDLPVKH